MKTVKVKEACEDLNKLVREVATGHEPVFCCPAR